MLRHKMPQTRQHALIKAHDTTHQVEGKMADIGQVQTTYSDRMTCDVTLLEGLQLFNAPIYTRAGTVDDGKVYGEVDLPVEKDYVIVLFIGGRPMVFGTYIPFLNELFAEDSQTLAGPDNIQKTRTLKLLESDKPLTYKRVFPSGDTIEIDDDGSYFLEIIDLGRFVFLRDPNDETNSFAEWKSATNQSDQFCRILMRATDDGILIEDTVNSNVMKLNSDGFEVDDQFGNRYQSRSNGITILDSNGNTIEMRPGMVEINGNLRVLQ